MTHERRLGRRGEAKSRSLALPPPSLRSSPSSSCRAPSLWSRSATWRRICWTVRTRKTSKPRRRARRLAPHDFSRSRLPFFFLPFARSCPERGRARLHHLQHGEGGGAGRAQCICQEGASPPSALSPCAGDAPGRRCHTRMLHVPLANRPALIARVRFSRAVQWRVALLRRPQLWRVHDVRGAAPRLLLRWADGGAALQDGARPRQPCQLLEADRAPVLTAQPH